jgi:hypothetical protein
MLDVLTLTGLSTDTLIQVKVHAHNSDGWGDYSEINTSGSTIETTPSAMSVATFDASTTTTTAIDLTWSELTGTSMGGSSVTITGY